MKKIAKILLSCILALITVFGLTACKEVESGSVIQRMTVELEFLDAKGEVVDTQNVEVKLYMNFAPKTCEHFIKLAEDGYYNGTTVSHVSNSWMEFGGYEMSESKLVKKEYSYDTLEGEFKKNGFLGNELTSSTGVLIMKRNYDTKEQGVSQYNSAESTVIMTFSAVSRFDESEYCVFGKIVDDDGEKIQSDSDASEEINRTELSSFAKIETIKKLQKTEEGTVTYYYENYAKHGENDEYKSVISEYYTETTDEEGNKHYYMGTTVDPLYELTEDELTLYNELYGKNSNYFLNLPYTQVRIASVSKKTA